MRTLEAKHVCPYIPGGGLAKKEGIEDVFSIEGYLDGTIGLRSINNSIRTTSGSLQNVKLVLRPMADLEGQIVHKGREFNAFHALDQMALSMDVERPDWDLLKDPLKIHQAPSWQITVLIGWGFDVFSLIPEGLALDMNERTLK